MNYNFEQALTLGQAQWIASCVHDAAASRLVISLAHNTDNFSSKRMVEFTGITNIEHRWTARDDNSVEGLLGAQESLSGALHRYLLVTDQREIELTASSRASIKDV